MASLVFDESYRYRFQVLRREESVARQIRADYTFAQARAKRELEQLIARVEQHLREGKPISESWLYREARLRGTLQQVEGLIDAASEQQPPRILAAKREAILVGGEGAEAATRAGLQQAQLSIAGTFRRAPEEAFEELVMNLADGTPLAQNLAGKGHAVAGVMREELLGGLLQGQSPREVARLASKRLENTSYDALRTSRTEILRAYRGSALENYRQNADILIGWGWLTTLDGKACLACVAMHGSIHPLTEEFFGTHPNCRCGTFPVIEGIPVDVQTGPEWFAQLSQGEQREMMTKKAFEAYRAGEVRLEQFMGYSVHPDWGPQRRELALADAVKQPFPPRGMGVPPDRVDEVAKVSQNVAAERTYGQALRLVTETKEYRGSVQEMKAAVDRVINPQREVRTVPIGFYEGKYVVDQTGKMVNGIFDPTTWSIRIRKGVEAPGVSGLHELGHAFQIDVVEPLLVASPDILGDLKRSWDETRLVAAMRAELNLSEWHQEFFGYQLRDAELFARAFAQYIIANGRSRILRKQLRQYRTNVRDTGHWEDSDFLRVEAAMDRLIRRIGWRK